MNTVVGLDVGRTKICCLVGEVTEENQLRIIGSGITRSQGIKQGVVVDVEKVSASILAAVEKAEQISGYHIENAYVGVTGAHISSVNSRGRATINRNDHEITTDDVERALENAQAIAFPHNREIVHVIPRGFMVDGENGVRDPVGIHGYRLDVEAHIVTGAMTFLQNLEKCMTNAGIGVTDFILQPLASGEAVLRESEREMGAIMVDIGGGTTDIAVFINGSVWHTISLKVGGNHITNDIATGLQVPFSVAEDLKIRYGHALESAVDEDKTLNVVAFGDDSEQTVSRRDLVAVINARVEEMFELILREVKRTGYDTLLPAGLVLCGGTASLAGIRALGQQTMDMPVRVGAPHDLEGLVDSLGSPAYATAVGLLQWGMRYADLPQGRNRPQDDGWWKRLGKWFNGAILPG